MTGNTHLWLTKFQHKIVYNLVVFSAAQEGNVSQCSLNGLLVNEMSLDLS